MMINELAAAAFDRQQPGPGRSGRYRRGVDPRADRGRVGTDSLADDVGARSADQRHPARQPPGSRQAGPADHRQRRAGARRARRGRGVRVRSRQPARSDRAREPSAPERSRHLHHAPVRGLDRV